jgi:hypothetical protein
MALTHSPRNLDPLSDCRILGIIKEEMISMRACATSADAFDFRHLT